MRRFRIRVVCVHALIAVFCCTESEASTFTLDYRTRVAAPSLRAAVAASAAGVRQESPEDGVLRQVEMATDSAPGAPEGLDVGDSLDVALFDDCRVALTLRERVPSFDGADSFLATADGYDGLLVAVVVCKGGRIHVDIQDFLSGRAYSVLSSAERTIVREIDSRRVPCTCAAPPEAPRPAGPSVAKAAGRAKAAAASPATVDILVVYDTLAAEWAKSRGGGVGAFAEVQVQKMNVVLANTDLDQGFRFRLVGVYEVGGSAGGSVARALEAAQSGDIVLNGVRWGGVHAKRDEVGADVVCVLVDNGQSYGTTGVGYSLYGDIGDFSEYAYNACLIRAVATGQTMTHEVGHNMGAGHATAVADVESRGPQYYGYSSGYYFTGADGEGYCTVMAYSSDGYGNYYSQVPFFSSPDYTYRSVPVGDELHDNSLTLRQTFPEVSRYREATTFRVTFGKNGGEGGDDGVTVTRGQPMPTPRAAPQLAGWTFAGYWDTVTVDDKGSPKGRQYYDKDMKSVRAWDKKCDSTLWAKWTSKVALGKNGGEGGDDYVTVTKGQPMPTPRTAPQRTGWAFGGYWDTVAADADGKPKGRQFYDADMKSARNWDRAASAKLWAKWTVRVKFGKNGGTGGDDYVTATYNQPFPKRTMPEKRGYDFGGYWVSSDNGVGQCYDADGTGTSTMKWRTGGTPTIWARWTNQSSL